MQTVLIPLDGSPESNRIVEPVIEHLSPHAHRLLLLRVRAPGELVQPVGQDLKNDPVLEPRFPTMVDAIRALGVSQPALDEETAASRLAQELYPARHRLETAGFTVETAMAIGEPAEEIERMAADRQVGLIAMTTHGRSGVPRLLMGSVAEHILRHMRIPVMLLRAN